MVLPQYFAEEVLRLRPAAVVVHSVVGAVRETYEALVDALRQP